jgi:hypothetical protein
VVYCCRFLPDYDRCCFPDVVYTGSRSHIALGTFMGDSGVRHFGPHQMASAGTGAPREHVFKHLFDTLIPAVSVIVTIFLYRLLWAVPQTINAQFLSIKLPIPSFGPPSPDMCKLDRGACAPRPPTPVLITPNHPGRRDDPRLAVVGEANDLANKIQHIGDHLSVQITAEHQRLIDLQSRWGQARAEGERPFVLMSIDDIHEMEMQRYEQNCEKRVLAVREKLLAEIPDVPIKLDPNSSSTITTMAVAFMYTHEPEWLPHGSEEPARPGICVHSDLLLGGELRRAVLCRRWINFCLRLTNFVLLLRSLV